MALRYKFFKANWLILNRIKLNTSRSLCTNAPTKKTIRIGCASGFWGDTATAVPQLVNHGKLDFLVFDYLSEITMSLLVASKNKNPELGYTPDFVSVAMAPFLSSIKQQGIKVVSNGGGINPHGCALALKKAATSSDINLKIAVVTGDDLMSNKKNLETEKIVDMNTGKPLPETIHSMNAYLGAGPIAQALDMGADVVITGRCVDSALVLGPLIHNFQWQYDDFDKLAAGSLAGHLLECGAQSTGGIHTDWETIPHMENMGFPIAECSNNGDFVLTKPENTGGRVTFGTVAEQLLYEIDDPENYKLPDVICDFSSVTLTEIGDDKVLVKGAIGKPPTPSYKVSATYADGFRATAMVPVIGPKAALKAKVTGEAVLKRCQRIFEHYGIDNFKRVHMEILGPGSNYGANSESETKGDSREVVLWSSVHHDLKLPVDLFARELAHSATGAAPGLTTLVGGRPKATPVLRLFSFLYPKSKFRVQVHLDNEVKEFAPIQSQLSETTTSEKVPKETSMAAKLAQGSNTFRLQDLAYTRSGDKADNGNIGVIARHPAFLPYLKQALTPASVGKYFKHLYEHTSNPVEFIDRYEVPGIHGLNFVLRNSLGGGGIASLRSDPQGKALGQILLDFEIKNMPSLEELTK